MAVTVTLLGTGWPLPSPDRAGTSTLVQTGDATFLVDAGRGCLMRMAAAGVMPPMLSAVLLTHLHSDHITDLNDVITTHWVMNPEPATLTIVGPPGTQRVVDGVLAMLSLDEQYRIDHHADLTQGPQLEVVEVDPGDTGTFGATTVTAHETDHRPVHPTVGFRIEHDGAVAALAGDTVPCAGLDELVRDAHIYVQTVLRDDLVRLVPSERFQDVLDYHSTVADAGRTAAKGNVRTLMLTHMVPGVAPGQEQDWIAQAAEHFDGEILLGEDLMRSSAPAE